MDTMGQLHSWLELLQDPSPPPPTLSPPPAPHLGDVRDLVNAGPLRDVLYTIEAAGKANNHLVARNSPPAVDRQRVEYYVQLGYPQEIVETTIASLGKGAHDNDIMNRLIKRGAVASPNRSAVVPEDAPPAVMMVPVERPVPNSQNLRPIVVDGSNVAMRYAELQQSKHRMCDSQG